MVKVKVLEDFIDKYTDELHKKDSIFEATEERVNEILKFKRPMIEVIEEKKRGRKKVEDEQQ